MEMAEREYSKKGESMCPKDGWVTFRNSNLISGRLGKAVLGGNKGGLFGSLAADFSPAAAAAVMGRLAKMSARVMGDTGFRCGHPSRAAGMRGREGQRAAAPVISPLMMLLDVMNAFLGCGALAI
jgi:hypothetical protein